MVTTRSRGNKQTSAATTDATNNGAKRKGDDPSAPVVEEPATKLPKTDSTDTPLEELKKEELPRAPAPTPAITLQQPILDNNNSTNSSDTANGSIAPAVDPVHTAAETPSTVPPTATAIPDVASLPTDAQAAVLEETLKEPAPEVAPLPDLDTVLSTEPSIAANILATTPLVPPAPLSQTTIAAPTAPQLDTIPAPTPMATMGPLVTATTTTAPVSVSGDAAPSQESTLHTTETVIVDSNDSNIVPGAATIETTARAVDGQPPEATTVYSTTVPAPMIPKVVQQGNGAIGIETATPIDPAAPTQATNSRQSAGVQQTGKKEAAA